MKFNMDKCRALHLEIHNPVVQLKLGSTWMESSLVERDPQVLVANKLSMREE